MSIAYAQKNKNAVQTKRESSVSIIDTSSQNESLQRKADMANNAAQRAEAPRPNNTGMPDNLKSGIESLSGFSMDDVRVHYNSPKPATVQALAYTQGTDIHVAPGQEKHLPHEAWHVAQQMAGRVSPTTNINGMPVNDNAALEHEADVMGEKAVQCKCEKNFADKRISSFSSRVSNMRQFVVQREPEGNSVFAIEKIKNFLKDQFEHTDVSDSDAERVQTLFEDIRQVDLQFLAAMASAYGEDDSHFHGNVDDILAISKKETEKKDQSQSENGLLNRANVEDMLANSTELEQEDQKKREKNDYEIMVRSKIEYLNMQKRSVEEKIKKIYQEYNDASTPQERYKSKQKCKHLDSHLRYLEELKLQIDLLRNALGQIAPMEPEGTLFNQNVLLTSGDDGTVECYMSIVGPGHDAFKDIIQVDGVLKPSGTQLQIGIASPVRQFSLYLKYLVDDAAEVNNPPLIRSFKMSQDAFKKWQNSATSEKKKKDSQEAGPDSGKPMNEDFKTGNQFGISSSSSLFRDLVIGGTVGRGSLTTVVDEKLVAENDSPLLDDCGKILSLDAFKQKIGFGRWIHDKSVPKFVPSDVHLFDDNHTAFFEIAEKKANLYTAKELREKYRDYSQLMLMIEFKFGTEEHKEKLLKLFDEPKKIDDEKIKNLIVLNNKIPQCEIDKDKIKMDAERMAGLTNLRSAEDGALIGIVMSLLNKATDPQMDALKVNYGVMSELKILRFNQVDDFKKIKNFQNLDKIHVDALCFKILRVLEKNKNKKNKKQKKRKSRRALNVVPTVPIDGTTSEKEIDENGFLSYDFFELFDETKLGNGSTIEEKLLDGITVSADGTKLGNESTIEEKLLDGITVSADGTKLGNESTIEEKLLDGITVSADGTTSENESDVEEEIPDVVTDLFEEATLFAKRKKGKFFEQLNPMPDKVDDTNIPYDKFASFHRYVPKDGKTNQNIPFIGGASGTTRDISEYLLSENCFKDEKKYYEFQLLNASFMMAYGYHSSLECFCRAADVWCKKNPPSNSVISRAILQYVKTYSGKGNVLDKIKDIVNKSYN